MIFLARFQAIDDKDKAAVVRKLMQSSTPDFSFFYITALAVLMATFGLLLDNAAIVIGSMLIAPVLYPILGIALGLVMSNPNIIGRSFVTLVKSFALAVGLSALATVFFAEGSVLTTEVLLRTEAGLLHFTVAAVAGAAVAYILGRSEWSETLPGIAISVALLPPLATIGIGLAALDLDVITGATVLLLVNLSGIVFAAMVTFSMMNLYEKQKIAESTIKEADKKVEEEEEEVEYISEHSKPPTDKK
tara:strand:+ start:3471 stop:4211 length:741 start_codon:yes stop_codon:yes gene_type:complete